MEKQAEQIDTEDHDDLWSAQTDGGVHNWRLGGEVEPVVHGTGDKGEDRTAARGNLSISRTCLEDSE